MGLLPQLLCLEHSRNHPGKRVIGTEGRPVGSRLLRGAAREVSHGLAAVPISRQSRSMFSTENERPSSVEATHGRAAAHSEQEKGGKVCHTGLGGVKIFTRPS